MPVLITGISGMLGANLALDWAGTRHLAGTYRAHRPTFPGVSLSALDLAAPDGPAQAANLVRSLRPRVVVHCAAWTQVDGCQKAPDTARQINALGTEALARASRDIGAALVYISTDAVFRGERGGYREDDVADPVNIYAATKLEGEHRALEACPDTLVLRTNIFGLGLRQGHGLAEWMLGQARAGRVFPGFTDVCFAPVLVNVLGEVIDAGLAAGLRGVHHVAAATAMNKFDFGHNLLRAFSLNTSLIRPTEAGPGECAAPRPRNSALDGSRLAAQLPPGIALDLETALARMVRLDTTGRTLALRAAVA